MYINTTFDTDIIIKLNPGIYQLDLDSGTGKTYLYTKLKQFSMYGLEATAYSTEEYKLYSSLIGSIPSGKDKIILFDRYDIFIDKFNIDFEELFEKTNSIILVDFKCGFLNAGKYTVRPAFIGLSNHDGKNRIEVNGHGIFIWGQPGWYNTYIV